jgi:hypothetical protein
MESNRLSSILRKRQENSKFVNNPFDASVLSMGLDSDILFRRGASRLMLGRKKEALDEIGSRQFSCSVQPSTAKQNPA